MLIPALLHACVSLASTARLVGAHSPTVAGRACVRLSANSALRVAELKRRLAAAGLRARCERGPGPKRCPQVARAQA